MKIFLLYIYVCVKNGTTRTSKMLTYFSSLLPINEHYEALKDVSSFLLHLHSSNGKFLNECDLSIHEHKIIEKISAYAAFEIPVTKIKLNTVVPNNHGN